MLEIGVDLLGSPGVEVPTQEVIDAGVPPLVHIQVVSGMIIPLGQKMAKIPSTVISWQMSKEMALDFAANVLEAAEKLPEEKKVSDLTVATSLHGVEKLAEMQGGLRG